MTHATQRIMKSLSNNRHAMVSRTLVALAILAVGIQGSAQAKQPHPKGHKKLHGGGTARILIQPPSPTFPQARLGFRGHMVFGWGMMVDEVIGGTTASQLGLEPGDVILKINDRTVSSTSEYQQLLRQAIQFHGGRVSLHVDNVRARSGYPVARYVFVTGWLYPTTPPVYSTPVVMTYH